MQKPITQEAIACGLMAAILGAAFPEISLAQVGELSQVAGQVQEQSGTIPGVVIMIMFIVGIIFIVLGILDFKKHADRPSETPLKNPIIKTLVGGGFVGVPGIVGFSRDTLGLNDATTAPNIGSLDF